MKRLHGRHSRRLALCVAGLLCAVGAGRLGTVFFLGLPPVSQPASAQTTGKTPGNGVNVIIMIGDGMGWEMARAAAIKKGTPLYTSGKGSGLSFQNLAGYTYATTYGTTIAGGDGVFNTGNSALDCSNPDGCVTGTAPVRSGFSFNPLPFNPAKRPINGSKVFGDACAGGGSTTGGNLVGYDPIAGGPNPWTPIRPGANDGYKKEYIKCSYPDSANTATTLYTGVKTYNGAIAVDIHERNLTTILQTANRLGKSTGLVTSVPITHATPGAAEATVNSRSKYDNHYPALDNILQEAIRPGIKNKFLPTVLLGGGHPLDSNNVVNTPGKAFDDDGVDLFKPPGTADYTYIKEANYNYLRNNPTTSNRYGYRFLERGANAANKLANTARQINPEQGDRLLGLYGARGQNGNIPTSSANGDYSNTGLNNFSLFSTAEDDQIPEPDTDRPLQPGETVAEFIARERAENPKLVDMTSAALEVLGKDKDGFWLMVEGGDIDWAAHDNNMDNLLGTMQDFDKSVQAVVDWIGRNGGWEKNLLIVTADHDHYLTLNDNFPQLLKNKGARALTFREHEPAKAGHFWGSDPDVKYGWGTHTNRMVPVYFQGVGSSTLSGFVGKGYEAYGFDVPGISGAVDQSHIYQTMRAALTRPTTKQ